MKDITLFSCFSLLGVLQFFAALLQLLNISIVERLAHYKEEQLKAALLYIGADSLPSDNDKVVCEINVCDLCVSKTGDVLVVDGVGLVPVSHVELHLLTSLSNLSGIF